MGKGRGREGWIWGRVLGRGRDGSVIEAGQVGARVGIVYVGGVRDGDRVMVRTGWGGIDGGVW